MRQPEVSDREPGSVRRPLARGCTALVWVALVIAAAVMLHKSSRFIGIAPPLSIDDAIPNVAVTLAERGRYGFLASPTQGTFSTPGAAEVDRTYAFFNYGPLYFYLAAALTWVAGPSLTAFRMIHPAGLIVIGAVAAWTFRSVSLAGPAVLAAFLLELYFTAHSPSARPDIMVSLCAAGMFACLRPAIERGSLAAWWGAGFFAGSALTSHQIAAAMVPAAGVAWLWSALSRESDPERAYRRLFTFVALVAGGVSAAVVYLVAIDFRVSDLLTLGAASVSGFSRPFAEAVTGHFWYAWAPLATGWRYAALIAFVISAVLATSAAWLPRATRLQVLALVMPPVVAALLYQVSLGLYGNSHTGYAILAHVCTLWAIGAAVSVAARWIADRNSFAGLAAMAAALALLVAADSRWLSGRGMWESRAPGNVRIEDFIAEAVAPLPERASVWGSLYFGLDSGDRLDLTQLSQSLPVVAADFRADRRAELAPDYLVLSSYETDAGFVQHLAGQQTVEETVAATLPELRYRLVHLVYAPPYGVVRHYEQAGSEAQALETPGIAVNDGTTRQWSSRLGPPVSVSFTAADAVTAHVPLSGLNHGRRALVSQSAVLPQGFYLVEAELQRPGAGQFGYMLASSGLDFRWDGASTDYAAIPAAPYLASDDSVMLLVDHLGGRLYLSRFENVAPPGEPGSAYGFHVASVRAVLVASDNPERTAHVDVPAWDQWTGPPAAVKATIQEGGRIQLAGTADRNDVLLQSPVIRIPPHSTVVATIASEPIAGAVQFSVRAPDGEWLTPGGIMSRRIAFESGRWDRVRLVISNSRFGGTAPLDVSSALPELRVLTPRALYVDELMKCRSPYLPNDRSDCVR